MFLTGLLIFSPNRMAGFYTVSDIEPKRVGNKLESFNKKVKFWILVLKRMNTSCFYIVTILVLYYQFCPLGKNQ